LSMRDRISDEKIKEELRKLSLGDGKSFSKIVNILSQYIYNYPRVIFGADRDRCGDFFEYVLVRLRDILLGYRESEAKFLTWFTVVLRNRYLNYVRAEKTKHRLEKETDCVSLDAEWDGFPSLHGLIADGREYGETRNEEFDRLVDGIVTHLKDRQRLFFHLYFIETLRSEDCAFLAISLDGGIRQVFSGIREVRNALADKYELKSRLFLRLSDLYLEILSKEREGDVQEAEKLKKKREKVLEEYRRVKLNPPYEVIARILQVPIGTVSSGILRMKRDVRRYVERSFGGKMSVS
jgi:RNA polymerase sigma factor (sigma-70 family)